MDASGLVMAMIVIPLSAFGILFWIRMLEDCLTHLEGKDRLFWAALIVAGHMPGVTAYYFLIWRPRRRRELGLT
jgi:hypothetical protein